MQIAETYVPLTQLQTLGGTKQGGHQADTGDEPDEIDGQDETIYPVDFEKAGPIVDDEIHEILVAGLPQGVRLTAIMDCCHSGSVFDLPFTVRTVL